ncbi:hypothetical protein HYH03_002612 [Edaphochlamys debaryana]|uniref:Uncharacterized protein n=1 Tax=Edaphochlamys debaryana TaxID=47281 RepID=A0A836C5F7_9CHLO|nr:hypothetical protein HYH03_002612 [Edaphochlamys debaryana]|eukprot:KAG2499677.1 hypothetical protein HYH03_002612 [Edaphochlamys debaryana]
MSRYAKPTSGWTLLHQAGYWGNVEAARRLVQLGASITAVAKDGETPAQAARNRGHKELAALLEEAARGAKGPLWGPPTNPTLLPSSCSWSQARAQRAAKDLQVAYGGGVVHIAKGRRYYVDAMGRVLVGWHGTYDPPTGMDGEPMISSQACCGST